MSHYMKKPCEHCPFRNDVKPFLTPERGEQLAYSTENPYNLFPCHKTTVDDNDSDDAEMMCTEKTKECAGFLTMQIIANGENWIPEGFEPSYDLVYEDAWIMTDAYEQGIN